MTGKGSKLGGRGNASDADPASGMCDPCREKYPKLSDQVRTCDRQGCEGTWTWTVAEQMAAFVSNRPAPQRLCAADEARLSGLADREVPCSVSGCKRHGMFSKRAQLIAGAPDVDVPLPTQMCGPCGNVYEKIKDRQVTCGIQGCKHKWTWSRDAQIEDYAAGLTNEPPRRLCDSCRTVFGAIADREVRCRTSGCKHTWTWPRETQLNSAVAGKPVPKAPHRMCQRCIDLYSGMKDVERPCRRPSCKRTWTDKRGAQLARAVRGKTGDPYPHYCEECEKEIGEMEDRQAPCKTEHCPGTWTWTAAQQLAAGVRPEMKAQPQGQGDASKTVGAATATAALADAEAGVEGDDEAASAEATAEASAPAVLSLADAPIIPNPAVWSSPVGSAASKKRRRRKRRKEIRPPERRCEDCVTFLKDRKTREIPCVGCKTTIFWPPESQLQTHLGNWAEPTLCGACKRDLTEAARAVEREVLRHGGAGSTSSGPDDKVPVDTLTNGAEETSPAPDLTAVDAPAPSATPETILN